MKYFLSILFCLISIFSFAQKTWRIEYKQERVGEKFISPLSLNGIPQTYQAEMPQLRMLINDSIAQIHYCKNGYDPIKRKTIQIGEKLIHHGYFYDFKKKQYYSQCNLDKTLKYLIPVDTAQYKNWKFLRNEKTVLGYNCNAALSINENNDSTLVWFTNDLSCNNGFLFYYGVPGLVLEAYNQRVNTTVHYWAVKMEETNILLLKPKEGSIITQKDFSEIMKKRNEKMGGNYFIKLA